MKLFCEEIDIPVSMLTEAAEDGSKKYYIEGIFLQAEQKNRNGRIYPMGIMEREVNRYTESHIKGNRAWGELNHPPTPTVNLDRVSHRTISLQRENNDYIGKALLITENPMGAIAKGLLESGGTLGTSSRGMGTLKKNNLGIMEVQSDFHLAVAGDIVSDPSGPQAFVKGIMENAEWIFDVTKGSWVLAEEMDDIKKIIHATPKTRLDEAYISQWERFLLKLSQPK